MTTQHKAANQRLYPNVTQWAANEIPRGKHREKWLANLKDRVYAQRGLASFIAKQHGTIRANVSIILSGKKTDYVLLYRIVKALEGKPRHRQFVKRSAMLDSHAIRKMKDDGASYNAIAKKLKTTRSRVVYALSKDTGRGVLL